MLPSQHFIFGFIFSLLLYPIFGLGSLIILLSTIFIDFDHAIIYSWKFKDFNLKRMYKYFRHYNGKERVLCIFHTAEFLILIFILGLFYKLFLLISFGLLFHVVLDAYEFFTPRSYLKRISLFFRL